MAGIAERARARRPSGSTVARFGTVMLSTPSRCTAPSISTVGRLPEHSGRAASEGAHGRGSYTVERSWRRVAGTRFQPAVNDQAGCDGPIPTASTPAMRLWP